jgi:putative transposase
MVFQIVIGVKMTSFSHESDCFLIKLSYNYRMTLKAYQYSISPNSEQRALIWQHFNHNRGVWNRMLALKSRYYRVFGKSLSKRHLQDHLVKLKKRPAFAWLKQVNS